MSETFVIPYKLPSALTVDQHYDTNNILIFALTFKKSGEEVSEEEWNNFMITVREFFKWVTRNDLTYRFVFDFTESISLPVLKMHDFMIYMNKKQKFLDKHLESTVVRLNPGLTEMVVRGVLHVFPPRRPLTIVCD
jgi:hypothetical protein